MAHTYKNLPINFPAVFKSIVAKVHVNLTSEVLTPNGINTLNFQHGTWQYIMAYMTELGKSNIDRYPLIALVHPFEVEHINNGERQSINCRLVIANVSNITERNDLRYTKNFEPILFPIYAELLSVIEKSKYFINYNNGSLPKHTRVDHPHWNNEQNVGYTLNDALDGIEIRNLELEANEKPCLLASMADNTITTTI